MIECADPATCQHLAETMRRTVLKLLPATVALSIVFGFAGPAIEDWWGEGDA